MKNNNVSDLECLYIKTTLSLQNSPTRVCIASISFIITYTFIILFEKMSVK